MDVVKTLRPGQPGTQRLKERYGDRLVAVRYRLDRDTHTRYTTVELIIEQKNSLHDLPRQQPPAALVALRILQHEHGLQQRVRQAGGHWDPRNLVWLIAPEVAEDLKLQDRIIQGDGY